MSDVKPLYVRVLIVPEGDQWLAQGLDYDLAAQGVTDRQAMRSFVRILQAHIHRDVELGRAPLAGVPAAPERFEHLWSDIEAAEQSRNWETVPGDGHGAYVLSATAKHGTELHR